MRNVYSIAEEVDTRDRQSDVDRRRVFMPEYRPERRSGKDRRSGLDRRNGKAQIILKRNLDSLMEPPLKTCWGLLYGILLSVPIWALIAFMFIKKIKAR